MGLFSGKAPSYTLPQIHIPTAEEILNQYTASQKANTPYAFGAKESALQDLATPESTQNYYNSFQPTSFQQALANQYFQNVYPQQENKILNTLSLSGIESSPITARLLGDAYGKTAFDVGSYLSQQGQNEANQSLSSRLAQDPYAQFGNYSTLAQNQSNTQANYNIQQALSDYSNKLNAYNNKNQTLGTIGSIVGGIGGAFFGNPALGASIGGSLMGSSPISISDALNISNNKGFGSFQNPFGGGGSGIPQSDVQNVFSPLSIGGGGNLANKMGY